jgi:hypothetical protein
MQFIPYVTSRAFRLLDPSAPQGPAFVEDRMDNDGGIDAKFVVTDNFALDATVNPDFSQVESDNPQVTVNQRFEVFFPEKRPFFLENASYFQTPINLLFTRRIADPQVGGRLTGKQGAFTVGALLIDDEAPGKIVLEDQRCRARQPRLWIAIDARCHGDGARVRRQGEPCGCRRRTRAPRRHLEHPVPSRHELDARPR